MKGGRLHGLPPFFAFATGLWHVCRNSNRFFRENAVTPFAERMHAAAVAEDAPEALEALYRESSREFRESFAAIEAALDGSALLRAWRARLAPEKCPDRGCRERNWPW